MQPLCLSLRHPLLVPQAGASWRIPLVYVLCFLPFSFSILLWVRKDRVGDQFLVREFVFGVSLIPWLLLCPSLFFFLGTAFFLCRPRTRLG